LVQPSPGRLIAAEPKRPLQSERADAVLLARHEPHGHEPGPQRLARALENRPRGERRARVTAAAAKQFVRHRPRRAAHAAMRADEALRPAHTSDVLPTRLIVSEPLVDLLERARVVDTGYGMRVTAHPRQIARRLRSAKGIPTFVERVAAELPRALAWPATAYRNIAEKPAAPEKPNAPAKPSAPE